MCTLLIFVTAVYVCVDVDECADGNGGCSDTCVNMEGTFQCGCPDGQELDANFRDCRSSKWTSVPLNWESDT